MNEYIDLIQPVLLTLIEGIIAAIVPLLLWKLNAWAKAKVTNAHFKCAMDRVMAVVENAVLDVSQTYVKGVRRNGKWNGEAAKMAKERALELIIKRLGPQVLSELRQCLSHDSEGVASVIEGAVEKVVAMLKARGVLLSGGHEPPIITPPDSSER